MNPPPHSKWAKVEITLAKVCVTLLETKMQLVMQSQALVTHRDRVVWTRSTWFPHLDVGNILWNYLDGELFLFLFPAWHNKVISALFRWFIWLQVKRKTLLLKCPNTLACVNCHTLLERAFVRSVRSQWWCTKTNSHGLNAPEPNRPQQSRQNIVPIKSVVRLFQVGEYD